MAGGVYEILFNLEKEPGLQGSEGARVLAVQPMKMLSFTWNAPPEFPELRKQYTHVVIRLHEIDERATRVTLHHDGWGEGEEWEKLFAYFDRAWNGIVLPRLQHRFEVRPVAWGEE